jgi:hypothetical protein
VEVRDKCGCVEGVCVLSYALVSHVIKKPMPYGEGEPIRSREERNLSLGVARYSKPGLYMDIYMDFWSDLKDRFLIFRI